MRWLCTQSLVQHTRRNQVLMVSVINVFPSISLAETRDKNLIKLITLPDWKDFSTATAIPRKIVAIFRLIRCSARG